MIAALKKRMTDVTFVKNIGRKQLPQGGSRLYIGISYNGWLEHGESIELTKTVEEINHHVILQVLRVLQMMVGPQELCVHDWQGENRLINRFLRYKCNTCLIAIYIYIYQPLCLIRFFYWLDLLMYYLYILYFGYCSLMSCITQHPQLFTLIYQSRTYLSKQMIPHAYWFQ